MKISFKNFKIFKIFKNNDLRSNRKNDLGIGTKSGSPEHYVHIGGEIPALDHDVWIGNKRNNPSENPHIGGGIDEDLDCLL